MNLSLCQWKKQTYIFAYCEPKFSPRWSPHKTTMIKNPFPSSSHGSFLAIFKPFSKQSQCNVAQCRAKHGAMPFYMKSPTSIFILLNLSANKYKYIVITVWKYLHKMKNEVILHERSKSKAHLVVVYVTFDFLPVLWRKYRIHRSRNVQCKYLQRVFSIHNLYHRLE